ncbi:MAG TPA: type II toxin-antitoxin system HicA family toxin [Terriglobia bacterium]|nr:type II toxin-antitoxin system HicA family toxin [Terriglobia bacterium]
MGMPQNVWNQVKNLTADEIISALKKDGWESDKGSGAILAFIKKGKINNRVTVHYHPKKTYGAKLLQALLKDIGWSTEDLKRLKLIK